MVEHHARASTDAMPRHDIAPAVGLVVQLVLRARRIARGSAASNETHDCGCNDLSRDRHRW
jgi:hypothetical protein